MRGWLVALVVAAGCAAPAPGSGWLDAPPGAWNGPGAAVPHAPPVEGNRDPRCLEQARPPSAPEDRTVTAAGWTLVGPLQQFGGTAVVTGTAGFDGMCRWWGYQTFVFVDGRFAGTVSPTPMNSRTDGAATEVRLYSAGHVEARFSRYADDDPLCCPSRATEVTYRIARENQGPILVPLGIATSPSK